ncbi:DNA replication protein DnaC [Bradyrhizobium sp. USDA 326]
MLYQRVPRLFSELALARSDGRHQRLLRVLGRIDLLILDGVDGLTSTAS